MFKIFKNLKKSWYYVLIIFILLCIQAAADLELPSFTSNIVNVGIQQNGIENAVLEKISKDTFDKIVYLSNGSDIIINSYEEIAEDGEEVYILKNITSEENEVLNEELKGILIAIYSNEISASMGESSVDMSSVNIEDMPEYMLDALAVMSATLEYEKVGVSLDDIQTSYLYSISFQMLLIALIAMVASVLVTYFSSKVASKLGAILREKVYKKVLSFSNKEFREYSTASLITRTTNDVWQIQSLMTMLFRIVIYAPIIGIGGFIKAMNTSEGSMTWVIGMAIGTIVLVVMTLFIIAMPKFKKLQELVDRINLVSREIITGMPVIRAFNKQKQEEKRAKKANEDLMNNNIFTNRAMSLMMPTMMFIMNSISLLIVWVGADSVNTGAMQVGDVMAFIQYTMQIVISFLMISMVSIMIPRAAVSAKRINEILDTDSSIKDIKNPKQLDMSKNGLVEFKNMSFRYPDADKEILKDISFDAKPGEVTAIIGSTGSGKSTIINLIPRFYDVTNGEILVNGVNVNDVTQKDLRSLIGYIPQKGLLFSGTIESNIKYSNPDMSDEKMIKAAKIAQAEQFIEEKPEKYQAEISQGGTNVSGGQRQRISIARAIAKDPDIYIFDDSFSALDYKTDAKLREALKEITKNKTVIIVAQRINTILNADKIIVLEEGKIVGIGTHKELLQNSEVYQQIALSQLSKEELE